METTTVKQLRAIAKERGVKYYCTLRKPDLIAAIKKNKIQNPTVKPPTVKQLRAIAKERGVKKYYAMRKAHLIAAIKAATEPFVLIKSKSALKNLQIDGRAGYDPESFLKEVKELVTDKLQNLRQTKVKMILRCMMIKTNIATGKKQSWKLHSTQM